MVAAAVAGAAGGGVGTSSAKCQSARRCLRPISGMCRAAVVSSVWPTVCAYAGIGMLIVALARPQAQVPEEGAIRRGYDLVICIDLSNSMFSEDFKRGDAMVNRLQAVRPGDFRLHQQSAQ